MTKPFILMISGWAGSGKDAAATLLVDEMDFTRKAFADPLKEDVAASHRLSQFYFTERNLKDKPLPSGKTPRDLLIEHAALARATDPDIYSRKLADELDDSRFVISDWRYQREYDFLCANIGATIVRCRIIRPGVEQNDDPTEHDLDNVPMDLVITNDGCISDLRDKLKYAIRPHLSAWSASVSAPATSISEHPLEYLCAVP